MIKNFCQPSVQLVQKPVQLRERGLDNANFIGPLN